MIAISATNPCHMWDMAVELWKQGGLDCYYSGYPRWRLHPPEDFPMRSRSGRTLVTYFLNRLPSRIRPPMQKVFMWQDNGFDRWVASALAKTSFVHAMPGQALQTFRKAREIGVVPVLNHATGPLWRQNEIVAKEYARIGLPSESPDVKALSDRHRQEYNAAEYHCVASTIVKEQLVKEGVSADKIWVIPYSANPAIFHPARNAPSPDSFRIVFAGQLVLRKGLRTLLKALEMIDASDLTLDCYGIQTGELEKDLKEYSGKASVGIRGPVSQTELAEVLRGASLLVLPSLEEGFGLVVPQALACGCPCLVSDRVGAKDLIDHRVNGSIFPVGESETLANEILWWRDHATRTTLSWTWEAAARELLKLSMQYGGLSTK